MNDAVVSMFVATLLVCSLSGTALAGAGAPAAPESPQSNQVLGALATTDDADAENDTVRHQNPDEYDAEGDDAQLESWLSNQLSSQLQDSTIALSEGEYDLAREYVDEEYQDRLGQYVEVTGETESTSAGDEDGEPTEPDEAYEQAAAEQERLADNVEEYRETKAEYEAALEAGDDERAHELARELEELYAEIDEAGGNAVTSYEVLTNETDADLSEAAGAVNETRDEIADEQTVVREQQFVETELHLETDDETASFSDPLVVHGEIRTADGSSVEDEEIQLLVEGEPVTVDSESGEWWSEDADGGFELEYRPTTLDLESEAITVEYVPDDASTYLGSEAELDVDLEQEEPTITDLEATDEVAYGETLQVSGELAVDGVPVDDVPLAVTVDGESFGTLNVSDGTFSGSGPVPANVSDGDQTVRVSLPFEDQALAATTAEVPVTVAETETELAVEATAIGEDELAVEGSLETAGGEGLEGQPVQLQIDDTTETVTTDADGEFADTVTLPSTAGGEDVTVTATYEGTGTSLAAATTEAAVPVPGGEGGLLDGVPSSLLAVLGALLAIVTLTAIGWWHRRQSEAGQLPREPSDDAGSSTSDRAAESSAPSRAVADSLVSRAAEQLADGRADSAVRSCYAAVRHVHGATLGGTGALTHWEFYRQQADAGAASGAEADSLREIVEAYERAAFTPDSISESAARHVLERTRQLCETDGKATRSPVSESTHPSDD
ncbi:MULTISPECIES: putative sodium/potassium/calcium exchanger [Natrialbaceae]|uniref:hypothetical protein n=1 Tax=Natrialbaceae TaxID=1644061 RepID=UPI00207CF256|nr:hypothetical protein [Natronococcus sp. CG52]